MRCRKCSYQLRDLPAELCPECGTPFERDDPLSFRGSALARHEWYRAWEAATALIVFGLLSIFTARVRLAMESLTLATQIVLVTTWLGFTVSALRKPNWPSRLIGALALLCVLTPVALRSLGNMYVWATSALGASAYPNPFFWLHRLIW